MRVALDYTPAIEQRAGVGRYTRSLFDAMARHPDGNDLEWTLWFPADAPDTRPIASSGTQQLRLPLRSRWLNLLWHRLGIPLKFERYAGEVSVIHGTDFVVPPSRAPSVVTVHDLSFAILPEVAFPRLRRYLMRAVPRSIDRAARVIAVSEATKNDICEFYEIAPHRVEVIHHAADPIFRPPSEGNILNALAQFGLRRPYFVIVGTVEPRKDHLTLLQAFERVHQQHLEVSLVIVGRTGWLAEETIQAINESARQRPVLHLQHVRDEALPALIGGAVALVYPSRYEGFGLPLLEAMACHTPVITTDLPVLREVAGDSAEYVESRSPESLSQKMLLILEDEEHRRRLVESGATRAALFSWEHAAGEHLRLYREIARG